MQPILWNEPGPLSRLAVFLTLAVILDVAFGGAYPRVSLVNHSRCRPALRCPRRHRSPWRNLMPFIKLDQVAERELVPGFRARFVHGERMTVGQFRILAGSTLPAHSHPHEQITTVVEGRLEFTLGGETTILQPGVVAVIPPNALHSGKALADCLVVDVFCPVREDYR